MHDIINIFLKSGHKKIAFIYQSLMRSPSLLLSLWPHRYYQPCRRRPLGENLACRKESLGSPWWCPRAARSDLLCQWTPSKSNRYSERHRGQSKHKNGSIRETSTLQQGPWIARFISWSCVKQGAFKTLLLPLFLCFLPQRRGKAETWISGLCVHGLQSACHPQTTRPYLSNNEESTWRVKCPAMIWTRGMRCVTQAC